MKLAIRSEFNRWVFCTEGNWRMWVMIAFWLAVVGVVHDFLCRRGRRDRAGGVGSRPISAQVEGCQ